METEKQLAYIRFIYEQTGIKYKGKTKYDASEYISKNKKKLPLEATENIWALQNGY